MKPIFLIAAFAVIITALVFAWPERLINPGPLMEGHRELKNSCLSCHKPFEGASLQCISCHKQADIGIRNVAGRVLPKKSGQPVFHSAFSSNSCVECHTEHKGLKPQRAVKNFRHDFLSANLKNNCIACHKEQTPKDNLHLQAGEGCASCHDTVRWKNAILDHGKLAASGRQCVSCHKKDLPDDALHRQSKANCSECHLTTRWKPATFNHDRYFMLDGDHRASCVTCHPDPKNYKAYTCYNCHEHSRSRMAAVHQEEGIRNLDNCIRCHRSTSGEHEGREGGERREGRGDDD